MSSNSSTTSDSISGSKSQKAASAVLEIAENIFRKKLPYTISENVSKSKPSHGKRSSVESFCPKSNECESTLSIKSPGERYLHDSGVSSPLKSPCDIEDEIEMKKVKETLDVIQLMFSLHCSLQGKLKEDNDSFCKELQRIILEVNSIENLEKRLRMIENFNMHLKKIIDEGPELTQKLRNPKCFDALDIEYSYHKFIVESLNFANSMMHDLENNAQTIQWYNGNNLEKSINMESYIWKSNKIITELQKNFEWLVEFRSTCMKMKPDA